MTKASQYQRSQRMTTYQPNIGISAANIVAIANGESNNYQY